MSESDDDRGPGVSRSLEFPWGLSGSRAVIALIPVNAQALRGRLPEGFAPLSVADAFGLPPDPRGDGVLALETFRCASAVGLDEMRHDVSYGAIFSPVSVPDAVARPDADIAFFKWETLVPDAPRRERLAELGLPVVDGSSDLSHMSVTAGGAHAFEASLTLDEATFRSAGSAEHPNEAFRAGIAFVEFQQANAGIAAWSSFKNTAAGANSGTGTVSLPADHWTTEIVGATTSQAFFVASTDVTFEEARIVVPR